MSFERAQRAYDDVEEAPDPFGRQSYVLPRLWTATHVGKRLLDGFRVIDATTTVPGPKAFGNAWPEMGRQFADLVDPDALKNHRASFEAAASRGRYRPNAIEIDMAEEACLWPASFLPLGSAEADALHLWILATARGLNVQRILNRRAAQADAMISAIRRNAGMSSGAVRDPDKLAAVVRGVLASANILIDEANAEVARLRAVAEDARKKGRSEQRAPRLAIGVAEDVAFARKLAVQRLRKIVGIENLITRAPQARIRRSEVMPGKVCDPTGYDDRRRLAASEIAEKLHARGVAIR